MFCAKQTENWLRIKITCWLCGPACDVWVWGERVCLEK